jgi:GWxTD domain-containing protein
MMERLLIDCALRAVLAAMAVHGAIRLLRIDTAAGRHTAWTIGLVAMLLSPLWTMAGPRVPLAIAASPVIQVLAPPPVRMAAPPVPESAPILSTTAADGDSGGASVTVPAAATGRRFPSWRAVLWSVYGAGALLLLVRLALGTWRTRQLRRQAIAVRGSLTSDRCVSPMTVGWMRPVTILPARWDRWPAAQLRAVLAHEGEHARRRDPLIQWIALVNRALFWFHPLAWWLERRLAALAEEACDSAVLRRGHHPVDYSECLLAIARSVTSAGGRLNFVGAAMPGGSLPARIHRILQGAPDVPLSRRRLASLVTLCAFSSALVTATRLEPSAAPARTSARQTQAAIGKPLAEFWWEDDEWHLEVASITSPEEGDAYRRLQTTGERDTFVAEFWRRRDPRPDTAANEFKDEFERRIAHAKVTFADRDSAATFGYQTDRGRWYVSFGPPDSVTGGNGSAEEWRYRSLKAFGSDVAVSFHTQTILGCSYRGGRYRITSPAPLRREGAADSRSGPYAIIYPAGFVHLGFPIDPGAVALRWGMRAQSGAEQSPDEPRGPIDHVQGQILRTREPTLSHLVGQRLFEPNGIACTEQLPPDVYSFWVETTFATGDPRRESVTFDLR